MKHGWEKKWVVLDDQMLQLFDKENMGGKGIFASWQLLYLTFLRNYIVIYPFFRKLLPIGGAAPVW